MAGETVRDALEMQRVSCAQLGSAMYADLLVGLAADFEAGGITHGLLADRPERPVHDAIVLRLLGAVHRIVLRGDAPDLAAHFPSAGGDGSPVPIGAYLAVLQRHADELHEQLGTGVQTNEVGRCAPLAVGFSELSRRWRRPLRLLEVGASAGLNLNWDRYWYDTGSSTLGDPASAVRFDRDTVPPTWDEPLDLGADVVVADRRGCDRAPLDPADASDRMRLLSFVWPDQQHRFRRLQAALDVAAAHPPLVDAEDAGAWLEAHLPCDALDPGTGTVVYHSIVWQYLDATARQRLRSALTEAGRAATVQRPLAWLRMEPAGPVTDLRVTTWPGAHEETLAHAGFHGQHVRFGPPPSRPRPARGTATAGRSPS